MSLTLRYDIESSLLLATASELSDFVDNIDDYTSIEITTSVNCSDTTIIQEYDTSDIYNTDNKFYVDIDSKILYLSVLMFSPSMFTDGIYKVTIKFKKEAGGYIQVANCIFVDITFKCKVASLMDKIISENKTSSEKTSTIAHILHYALFNGSNCGCNCEDMCDIFKQLSDILDTLDLTIDNNCGC